MRTHSTRGAADLPTARTSSIQWTPAAAALLATAAGVVLAVIVATGARGGTIEPFPSARINDLAALTPSVSTSIHDPSHVVVTSVSAGTTVHDSVFVGGGKGNPTPSGSIAVRFFTNGTCSGSPAGLWGGTLNASGFADVVASAKTVLTVGAAAYSYRGQYLGNATFAAAEGPCEPLSVTKARPVVSTKVHDVEHKVVTSVELGAAVHDFVAVTGVAGTPTGTVTVNAYLDGTCSVATLEPHTATLDGGIVDVTGFSVTYTIGSSDGNVASQAYAFRVTYSGDAHYAAATGACEPYTVTKHKPTISSAIHDISHGIVTVVNVGTIVHDSVVITGTASFVPSGTATSRWFPNGTCAGSPVAQGPQALIVGATAARADNTTISEVAASPSKGSFQMTYSGDNRYQAGIGPCEPVTWKGVPDILAQIHNVTHVPVSLAVVGTPLHLRVTMSGAFGVPAGAISYQMWANSTCSLRDSGQTVLLALTVGATTSVSDAAGVSLTPSSVGTYSFKAEYGGSATYLPASSPCLQIPIQRAVPFATTTVLNAAGGPVTSVVAGSTVHASVAVRGPAGIPTGSVRFDLFATTNCTGLTEASAMSTLTSGGTAIGAAIQLFSPGPYAFRAEYLGDANYLPALSACEPFTVLASGVTPPPTATPGPVPTATPAATGTVGPGTTAGPAPTGTPGAPTGSAGGVVPGASAAPGPPDLGNTPSGASSEPGASAAPVAGTTARPGESAGLAATAPGAVGPVVGSPAGANVLPIVIVGLVVVLFIGRFAWAWRRRSATAQEGIPSDR